jgi:hypothetical protein
VNARDKNARKFPSDHFIFSVSKLIIDIFITGEKAATDMKYILILFKFGNAKFTPVSSYNVCRYCRLYRDDAGK